MGNTHIVEDDEVEDELARGTEGIKLEVKAEEGSDIKMESGTESSSSSALRSPSTAKGEAGSPRTKRRILDRIAVRSFPPPFVAFQTRRANVIPTVASVTIPSFAHDDHVPS